MKVVAGSRMVVPSGLRNILGVTSGHFLCQALHSPGNRLTHRRIVGLRRRWVEPPPQKVPALVLSGTATERCIKNLSVVTSSLGDGGG